MMKGCNNFCTLITDNRFLGFYFFIRKDKNVGYKLVFKISTLKILEADKDEIKAPIESRTQYILLLREKG